MLHMANNNYLHLQIQEKFFIRNLFLETHR